MVAKFTIDKVIIKNFKNIKDESISLNDGLSVIVGKNNSGKTTLLQALAIWEFCKIATLMERSPEYLTDEGKSSQGFGIDVQDFTPVSIPEGKLLWTNLQPINNQNINSESNPETKKPGKKAYTLHIVLYWNGDKHLGFALSLQSNRIYIKTIQTNLDANEDLPTIAFVPTYAGMNVKERRIGSAERRKFIGQGAATQILRNVLLDMKVSNDNKRMAERGESKRIPRGALENLRKNDPWELLQQNLRKNFNKELQVENFNEQYHTAIRIQVIKGEIQKKKIELPLNKHKTYQPRDIMVEGVGFLQWIGVFAFLLNDEIDLLLLDEPDAHLHPTMQKSMISDLIGLAKKFDKQVIIATHSPTIVETIPFTKIMNVEDYKYLTRSLDVKDIMRGLGAHYDKMISDLRSGKNLIFCEGPNDADLIRRIFDIFGDDVERKWYIRKSTDDHKIRKIRFSQISEEVDRSDLICFSIRDRDQDHHINEVDEETLSLRGGKSPKNGFYFFIWRLRNIESYLIQPSLLCLALKNRHGESVRLKRHKVKEDTLERLIRECTVEDVGEATSKIAVDDDDIVVSKSLLSEKFIANYFSEALGIAMEEDGEEWNPSSKDGHYPPWLENIDAKDRVLPSFNLSADALIRLLVIGNLPEDFHKLYDRLKGMENH